MDITEICLECKNFFLKDHENSIHAGTYTISNGEIEPLDFLKVGQYFYIKGSDIGNERVWLYTGEPIEGLKDETFTGSIYAMSVPSAFLQMCKDIDEWRTKFENVESGNMSPWASESVTGVYSKTAKAVSSEDGGVMTWKSVFKSRLSKWRKISIL